MSDLISRQTVLDAISELPVKVDSMGYTWMIAGDVINQIDDIPSAKPEQKKGKWIDEKINSYTSRTYCSECSSSAPFVYKSDDYYGNHAYGETVKPKFCPNCGADMRGQDEQLD